MQPKSCATLDIAAWVEELCTSTSRFIKAMRNLLQLQAQAGICNSDWDWDTEIEFVL